MKRIIPLVIAAITAASCLNSSDHPIGNGRLGMMPYGGVHEESIILNEISLWSGSEADYANPDAAASLQEIRSLLLEGRNVQAQDVMYERFVPHKPTDGGTYGSYEVLGQICMKDHHDTDSVSRYTRGLDLKTATAWTEFTLDDVTHTRRYYVSRPADVIVLEVEADRRGSVSFDMCLDRAGRCTLEATEDGLLKMYGSLDSGAEGVHGMRYASYAKVFTRGGKARTEIITDSTGTPYIHVRNADKAWIVTSAATNYLEKEEYQKHV